MWTTGISSRRPSSPARWDLPAPAGPITATRCMPLVQEVPRSGLAESCLGKLSYCGREGSPGGDPCSTLVDAGRRGRPEVGGGRRPGSAGLGSLLHVHGASLWDERRRRRRLAAAHRHLADLSSQRVLGGAPHPRSAGAVCRRDAHGLRGRLSGRDLDPGDGHVPLDAALPRCVRVRARNGLGVRHAPRRRQAAGARSSERRATRTPSPTRSPSRARRRSPSSGPWTTRRATRRASAPSPS